MTVTFINIYIYISVALRVALRPHSGWWLSLTGPRHHTHWTHHIWLDSSGRVISPTQRPVRNNTQHSQETNFHASGGVWTRNASNAQTAKPRLRPRSYWDRLVNIVVLIKTEVPYILESNPHPLYSFRGLKNQMRIRIACGLDSRSRAAFWKNDRAAVRAVRTIQ